MAAAPVAPRQCAAANRVVLAPGETLRREIGAGGGGGVLQVVPSPGHEVGQAWQRAMATAGPAAGTIAVLGLTGGFAVQRTAQPVADIMRELARLGVGSNAAPIGPYPPLELTRIAAAVNELSATLASSVRARLPLAKRLRDARETKRTQLARELHDESGQHLSAIGAIAVA